MSVQCRDAVVRAPLGTGARAAGRKVTLLCVATLTIMAGATISPSLPEIEAAFSSVENIELLSRLVLTLPALFVALCAPLIGTLADKVGRRRLLLGTILLYGLSGMSGVVVDGLGGLLVGRASLGVAVAGIMTLGTALAGDYFAGTERDRYMGLQQAFTGFGGLAFLTGGGFLADIHWRGPFAVYGLAFILLPAAFLFLQEPRRFSRKPADPVPPAMAATAVIAAGGLCVIGALNSIAFYLIPSQLPFHLKALGIPSPSDAGIAMGLLTLAMALTSLGYGKVRARLGIPCIFGMGFMLMAAGLGLVGYAVSLPAVEAGTVIIGIGMGLVMPNLMAASMAIATLAVRGRVAGALTASVFIGQFISPFVSQPWISSFGYLAAFRDAGILLTVVATISIAVGLMRQRVSIDNPPPP